MRPKNGMRRWLHTDAPLTRVAYHKEATMAISEVSCFSFWPQGHPSHSIRSQAPLHFHIAHPPSWRESAIHSLSQCNPQNLGPPGTRSITKILGFEVSFVHLHVLGGERFQPCYRKCPPRPRAAEGFVVMRFPIYEYLYQLNRNLQETVEILERIRKLPRIDRKKFQAYQVEIEFLRAEASQDIAEMMDAIEGKEAHQFWLKKKAYEKSIGDPDDIYFEVRQREIERRKRGLPSLIGIAQEELTKEELQKEGVMPLEEPTKARDTPLSTKHRTSGKRSKAKNSKSATMHFKEYPP
jgi:hypothetical protein